MRVLELFSGYGSQALALTNLGIEFVSDISEIDKYAIQAYNQLHGETHNWGDITKIDETKLPYYDLITYSSPCQDFSVAGLGKGGDEGSGTRSSLLWECERIIRAIKPKYLLMENVKNLVGKKHVHNFNKWLRTLEMMGYWNFWQVLNAKDYGVPQNRERVFVVSILSGGQYLFPNKIKLEKRLKDILELNFDEKYYLSDDIASKFFKKDIDENTCIGGMQENQSVKKDGVCTCLTSSMGTGGGYVPMVTEPRVLQIGNIVKTASFGGNPQRGRIYSADGCSPALNTMQGGGSKPKIVNNYRIRKLTPRECWRLMGVKDEQYDKLHDISNTQLYKMAGNSIVVDVLMRIFENMFTQDKNETKGQLELFGSVA